MVWRLLFIASFYIIVLVLEDKSQDFLRIDSLVTYDPETLGID